MDILKKNVLSWALRRRFKASYVHYLNHLLCSVSKCMQNAEQTGTLTNHTFIVYMAKLQSIQSKLSTRVSLYIIRSIHLVLFKYAEQYGTEKLSDLFLDVPSSLTHFDFYNDQVRPYKYSFVKENTDDNHSVSCQPTTLQTTDTLDHKLNGSTLVFYWQGYKIIADVLFKQTPLPTYKYVFPNKYNELIEKTHKLHNIHTMFVSNYVNQINTALFCKSSVKDIVQSIKDNYEMLETIKSKTISELVKLFLTSSETIQRDIIILLLINIEDGDTDHLAFLLYDMVTSKAFMSSMSSKADQNSNAIFLTLHWSVQQKLVQQLSLSKKALQNIKSDKIDGLSSVSYEKRIMLLKCEDDVKSKAFAKLKEIKNSKGDSNTKATQYLDGLLKIPFGIYKKEPILNSIPAISKGVVSWCNSCVAAYVDRSNRQVRDYTWWTHMYELCTRIIARKDISYYILYNVIHKIETECMTSFYEQVGKWMHVSHVRTLRQLADTHNISLTNKRSKKAIVKQLLTNSDVVRHFLRPRHLLAVFDVIEKYVVLHQRWNQYNQDKSEYITKADAVLKNAVYGLDDAKLQIKQIIAQWMNGEEKGYVFGFEGPMGTGKTTLAKKGIAECLCDAEGATRPFTFIALGGSTNGSTLEGHNYTYVGSTWGKIVECLMDAKCMNPIIYIDELDKISNTEHGREIVGILIHLTDPSQNEEFNDRYFSGIPLDISKCLIIFSYNDPSKVDKILLDRIHRIKTKALSNYEKFNIAHGYIIPELLELVGFEQGDIIFTDDVIKHIIVTYTIEAGVRKLKEKLLHIIRDINLRVVTEQSVVLPYTVTMEDVATIFDKLPKIVSKKIGTEPKVGVVNGLYASVSSMGGITLIQAFKYWADKNLCLHITGQQGDVMKESIHVSKTVAWHLLTDDVQRRFMDEEDNFGVHIHCPETSTPKDGPSAGGAMTVSMLSLFTGIPVDNTVAMTGEIDVQGNIMRIGGLSAKLEGARNAGIRTVLIPHTNQSDLDVIRKYEKEFVENDDFKVILVKTIYDILPLVFDWTALKKFVRTEY